LSAVSTFEPGGLMLFYKSSRSGMLDFIAFIIQHIHFTNLLTATPLFRCRFHSLKSELRGWGVVSHRSGQVLLNSVPSVVRLVETNYSISLNRKWNWTPKSCFLSKGKAVHSMFFT